MPSEALRILEALVKAKIALHESTNHDHRPHWVGVTCPSCGVDYRSISAVDGETRSNPYHDPSTGEFTSGPGGSGSDQKQGRKRKRLEKLRRHGKRVLRELRKSHATELKEHKEAAEIEKRQLLRRQNEEFRSTEREHQSERKRLAKYQTEERESLIKEHGDNEAFYRRTERELKALHEMSAEHLKEKGYAHEEIKAARERYSKWIEKKRSEHKAELAEQSKEHQQSHRDLNEEHEQAISELKNSHAKDIKEHDRDTEKATKQLQQRHERTEKAFIAGFKKKVSDFAKEHGLGRKSEQEQRVFDIASRARISISKHQKAVSAESILYHCLKQHGWTAAYKQGKLTQDQQRQLLETIRQYGRAWLRHESEQFVRVELGRSRLSEQGLVLGSRFKDMDVDISRAFFHPKDKGFFANLGRFFRRTKQFIRELIVAGVQAILGPAPLTGEDLDAAEREAQRQEQFFDRFHDEIKQSGKPQPRPEPIPGMEEPLEPPVMTPGQFTARVEKYADSAWQAPQRINRDKATQQGVFKLERRILGVPKTEHCSDCPPLAEMGWQPIGTLPAIGESECGPLCLCHFEYTEEEGKPPAFDGGMTREEYDEIIKRVEEYEPEFAAKVVMGED